MAGRPACTRCTVCSRVTDPCPWGTSGPSDLPAVRRRGLIPACSLRPPWLTLCLQMSQTRVPCLNLDRHKWSCRSASPSSASPQWPPGPGPSLPPSCRLRAVRLPPGPGLPAASVPIPLPFITGALRDVCVEKQMFFPFSKSCETSHTGTAG